MKEENIPEVETRLEVKNETGEDEGPAELYIYGRIRQAFPWEEDDDDTHVSARAVKNKLKNVPNDKELEIHINSPGGEFFESMAIRNLLVQHEGDLQFIIEGLAGSGASLITTAGPVVMFNSSMQMIHKVWGICIGNADDMLEMAANLEKMDDSALASYMKKFVGEEEELIELIAEETWLTAEEAKTLGLADEIWDESGEEEDEEDGDEEGEEPEGSVKENLFLKYKDKSEEPEGEPDEKSGLFNAFNN